MLVSSRVILLYFTGSEIIIEVKVYMIFCILNETFLKAVDSSTNFLFPEYSQQYRLSIIRIMPFHMKKPPRLVPWLICG